MEATTLVTIAGTVVGSVAIIAAGLRAGARISTESTELTRLRDELASVLRSESWKALPEGALGVVLSAVRSARLRGSAAVVGRVADKLERAVDGPRLFASHAVYYGLAGTLMGLTFAVVALQGIGSVDAEQLKERILTVVGGFGASFFCALAGVFSTVLVSGRVSAYSSAVEAYANDLEAFLAEVVLPYDASQRTTATEAIVEEVKAALRPLEDLVASLPTQLAAAFAPLGFGVGRLQVQIRRSGEALASEREAGSATVAAAKAATDALKGLEGGLTKAGDALDKAATKIQAAVQSIPAALGDLEATLESVQEVSESSEKTIATLVSAGEILGGMVKESGDAISSLNTTAAGLSATTLAQNKERDLALAALLKEFQSTFGQGLVALGRSSDRGAGTVDAMKDALVLSNDEGAKALTKQAAAFQTVVDDFKNVVVQLQQALDSYSNTIKDLPMAAASERISREIQGVAEEVRAAHQADLAGHAAASTRLDSTEQRVARMLDEFDAARTHILERLQLVSEDEETLRKRLQELDDRLHGPIWKLFRGQS